MMNLILTEDGEDESLDLGPDLEHQKHVKIECRIQSLIGDPYLEEAKISEKQSSQIKQNKKTIEDQEV